MLIEARSYIDECSFSHEAEPEVETEVHDFIFKGHCVTVTVERAIKCHFPASAEEPEETSYHEPRVSKIEIFTDATQMYNTLNSVANEDNINLDEYIFRKTGAEVDENTEIPEAE